MRSSFKIYITFILVILISILFVSCLGIFSKNQQREKRWHRLRLIEVSSNSLADTVLIELREGNSFQNVARRHSIHPTASKGGEIGWIESDGLTNDIKNVVQTLGRGEFTEIISRDSLFSIYYKMDELPSARYLEWKKQKAQIDSLLEKIDSFNKAGNFDAAMGLLESTETFIQSFEDLDTFLNYIKLRGYASLSLGRFSEAATLFDSLLNISKFHNDSHWASVALGNLGLLSQDSGNYRSAIAYFDSSLTFSRELRDRQNESASLGNKGIACLLLGLYPEAIACFDSALVITRKIGDRVGEARFFGNMGIPYRQMGEFHRSVAYYDSALAIVRQTEDRSGEARYLGSLGSAYISLSEYQKAIAYCDSALEIYKDLNDRKSQGIQLANKGIAYLSMAKYSKAISNLDTAVTIAREFNDRHLEGQLLAHIGITLENQGKFSQALAEYDNALTIARELNNRRGQGRHLGQMANIYLVRAEYSRAIETYFAALAVAQEINDRQAEADQLGNIGTTYSYVGLNDHALNYLKRTLKIYQEIEDKSNEATALGKIGEIYQGLGEYSKAIAYHDSALIITKVINARRGESRNLGNLGVAYSSLGQGKLAQVYLDSALVVSREIGDRSGEATWLGNLGIAFDKFRHHNRAIVCADSALLIAKDIGDIENIWRQYLSLAILHRHAAEPNKRIIMGYYEKGITLLDSISVSLQQDTLKQSFFEDKEEFYSNYIGYLVSQDDVADHRRALEISEKAKARAFTELIARRFRGDEVGQKKEFLAPANIDQIQATAKRLEASILDYFIADSNLVVWLIKPNGQLHTAVVPMKPASLDSLLDINYVAFNSRGRKRLVRDPDCSEEINFLSSDSLTNVNFESSERELFEILFPKEIRINLPQQEGGKLLLVPHRKLAVIPIMALKDEDGCYLLEKYSAHQVPGIGVLLQLSEIRKAIDKSDQWLGDDVLLLGNPEMPKWRNCVFFPLIWAEEEVRRLATYYQTQYLTGQDASEYTFEQLSYDKRLLHLASHGIAFDVSPLESFIALASGNGEDGILTAAEIMQMRFENADLVCLSACQSGLGKIGGDGIQGLARAFMTSGVTSVLVSLWSVDDEPTQRLMLTFYKNLNHGMDKAEALRHAQLQLMHSPKWSHPKYWASFVLYGERGL